MLAPQNYQDTIARTSAVVREPKPKEEGYPKAAVLLLHQATLYTNNDEIFLIQRIPIDVEVHQAIIQRIREIDPAIGECSYTHENTKLLLQSLAAPNIKGETTLQSKSVCLILPDVCLQMVSQLVPFLLVPRLAFKA